MPRLPPHDTTIIRGEKGGVCFTSEVQCGSVLPACTYAYFQRSQIDPRSLLPTELSSLSSF
ncbi:hypothetical protein COCC4DRAFT_31757 [Bipolaris maydis ATCC 48331]|uniref:Uncharacterized protein n=2 Tax=Cochliobolus heterostrophus TaxID=5016 RepID=M2UT50_COCH5|nr:uncharacterized protein COCC4DRAFT_31757 [Bipolaris maydis ATCC 48331]EMD91063.1 hypothetical protein COCHEDRAFT_1021802 [Bipolaris maydis C5]ENI05854.1 hypothetical protein COCC4DRAFT_31757 [Bipolaris maydis ATCC 48331]